MRIKSHQATNCTTGCCLNSMQFCGGVGFDLTENDASVETDEVSQIAKESADSSVSGEELEVVSTTTDIKVKPQVDAKNQSEKKTKKGAKSIAENAKIPGIPPTIPVFPSRRSKGTKVTAPAKTQAEDFYPSMEAAQIFSGFLIVGVVLLMVAIYFSKKTRKSIRAPSMV